MNENKKLILLTLFIFSTFFFTVFLNILPLVNAAGCYAQPSGGYNCFYNCCSGSTCSATGCLKCKDYTCYPYDTLSACKAACTSSLNQCTSNSQCAPAATTTTTTTTIPQSGNMCGCVNNKCSLACSNAGQFCSAPSHCLTKPGNVCGCIKYCQGCTDGFCSVECDSLVQWGTCTRSSQCQCTTSWTNNYQCNDVGSKCTESREKCVSCPQMDPCNFVETASYSDYTQNGNWFCISSTTLARTNTFHDYSCQGYSCKESSLISTEYQDCPNGGWFNTTNTQWIGIGDCKEKEQLQQEYRSPTCVDSTCGTQVTDHKWIDTGNVRDIPGCPTTTTTTSTTTTSTTTTTTSTSTTTTTIPTCSIDCNTLDNWHDTGPFSCNGYCERCKPQEYRDYSCVGVECVPAVTDNRELCEDAPAGKHCVDGSFTSSGYCGSSAAYCFGNCKYAVDKFECSVSGVCDKFDFTEKFNCPPDTACSSGVCSSYSSCGLGNVQCKDQCSVAQPELRCNGFGTCSNIWKWNDIASCNPYKCVGGSCNGCEKDCGAECETNTDCPGYCLNSIIYYDGSCKSDCTCQYKTKNCDDYDGWYDVNNWRCVSDCERCRDREYRDYTCEGNECVYIVTNTEPVCEYSPVGKHCVDGIFTSSGYCDARGSGCLNDCISKISTYECDQNHQCNKFDTYLREVCPVDTACLDGECRSDAACKSTPYCLDKCNLKFGEFRCNGFGNCVNFWRFTGVTACNPFKCHGDPFCSSICEKDCGAQCEKNSDCTEYCLGSIRFYDSTCSKADCTCDFQSEDCSKYSKWYDTRTERWSVCQDDACNECKQKKQEYRTYYCTVKTSGSLCKFEITDEQWINTGEIRSKRCSTGYHCVSGVCVKV